MDEAEELVRLCVRCLAGEPSADFNRLTLGTSPLMVLRASVPVTP